MEGRRWEGREVRGNIRQKQRREIEREERGRKLLKCHFTFINRSLETVIINVSTAMQ